MKQILIALIFGLHLQALAHTDLPQPRVPSSDSTTSCETYEEGCERDTSDDIDGQTDDGYQGEDDSGYCGTFEDCGDSL